MFKPSFSTTIGFLLLLLLWLPASVLAQGTKQNRVTGTCAPGSSIRVINADGTVVCEVDDNSGGTVTSVGTGSGLTGGPITTSGTISIAPGGVTSAHIADGAVGAVDVKGTVDPADDVAAPWSAYGYTADGFEKPELGAPGRYLVGPIPPGSTLASEHPDQLVGTDYMQLSGTSFATAAVSGAASAVLARHPDWTPDQVKGALMLTARVTSAAPSALGVGELDAAAAAAVQNPPNPNLALRTYVVPDPAGGPTPVFDSESWGLAAQSNPAWGVESWGLESWGLASWGVESWGLSYWSGADAGTGTPAGSPLNAATDAAAGDFLPGGGYWLARSP